MCVPAKTQYRFGGVSYLEFETLTMVRLSFFSPSLCPPSPSPLLSLPLYLWLSAPTAFASQVCSPFLPSKQCPISTTLLEPSLMSLSELTWLNAYHREVYDKLLPGLKESGDEEALQCVFFPLFSFLRITADDTCKQLARGSV